MPARLLEALLLPELMESCVVGEASLPARLLRALLLALEAALLRDPDPLPVMHDAEKFCKQSRKQRIIEWEEGEWPDDDKENRPPG